MSHTGEDFDEDSSLSLTWKEKPIPDEEISSSWKAIDWNAVLSGRTTSNHIFLRSALIRKDLLPLYVGSHMPMSFVLRADDDVSNVAALAQQWDVAHDELEEDRWLNKTGLQYKQLAADSPKWVLKPSDSSNAHGLRFCWAAADILEAFRDASSDEVGRETPWILQRVVPCCPLRLDSGTDRGISVHKFHIRALMLVVGDLDVYLYDKARVLVAPEPMASRDVHAQITNCSFNRDHRKYDEQRHNFCLSRLRLSSDGECVMAAAADVSETSGQDDLIEDVWSQMRRIVADIGASIVKAEYETRRLRAEGRRKKRHFFSLPNMYEVFGLDFMLDENRRVVLLESNPAPSRSLFPEGCEDGFVAGVDPVAEGVPPSFVKAYSKRLSIMIARMKAAAEKHKRAKGEHTAIDTQAESSS